ncbi:hypothetical protein Hoch_4378 [Haliangium ochraceum DSM 14365]|uniref:Lipoprotein n=2 Tax=Haliangium ochraceum TaxID=80816 RepID=D0LNG7_HALO1|nr:hypothetical protein Hoch_4378 [Haliangium ochraceum DSM 14365]
MRSAIVWTSLLAAALFIGGGCTRSDGADHATGHNAPVAPGQTTPRAPSQDTETKTDMANSPASDGEAWKQAQAMAAAHSGRSDLKKQSDELPFLFSAAGTRGVLVHAGEVITATGPAAAGAYLRDIGIVDGPGPSIASVLQVLFALHALPQVDELPEESYYFAPVGGIEELLPRVERDGGSARVVLHYMLPQEALYRPDLQEKLNSTEVGGPAPRPLARLSLEIGGSGEPAWQREDILWSR